MALAEIEIWHKGESKYIERFHDMDFDVVITVCDDAAANCPVWLGRGARVHLGFAEPAETIGTEAERLDAFRTVRVQIEKNILEFLQNWVERLTFGKSCSNF